MVNIVVLAWASNDINSSKEANKEWELDKDCKERTERLHILALVEIHHLERFELAVTLAVFLNLSEFRLNFLHDASLMKLTLHEWPHEDFY